MKKGDIMSGFLGKEKTVNKVVLIDVEQIAPNPSQPRQLFSEEKIDQLADSIKQNGLLQPLTVRKKADGGYELICGERRLRAGKKAGLEKLPCIVLETDERQSAVLALVENIQRDDLTFFEEARAIHSLIVEWGIKQEEAAERLGKAQSTVANKLRLLKLDETEQEMILESGLTERHARALLKIENPLLRRTALTAIAEKQMNVGQAERYIDEILTEPRPEKKRLLLVKDVRLFLNTINKALDTMKRAGIPAEAIKKQENEFIEYVVRIPLQPSKADR